MSDALGPLEGLLAGRVVCAPPADYRVEEVDVVVVGGGGAGLAAASAAAALGRRVVLLEKNAALGGSTAWSVGSVSASNTAHQRREGIMDCPEHHWEDLALFSGPELARDNRELARVLTSNAPETFEWLLSTGLRFVGPMPEPPHRRPRMHNVLPNSKAFPYHLGRHCRKLGVRIELDAKADALWMEDGRVKGVLATLPGSRGRVAWRALGGVVLAGGDFSGSPQLKATYASELVARVDAMNPGSTGEGIVLGLAAGAVVRNGDHLRGPFLRFVPPANPHWLQRLPPHPLVTELMAWAYRHVPSSLLRPLLMRFVTTSLAPEAAVFRAGAMLVDLAGRRIDLAGRNVHHAVADVQERMAYIVFDARAARLFTKWPNFVSTAPGVAYAYLDDYRNTRPDIFHEAPTVAAPSSCGWMPARSRRVCSSLPMAASNLTDPPRVRSSPSDRPRLTWCSRTAVWTCRRNSKCWTRTVHPSKGCTLLAPMGRAACCWRATATTSCGLSRPDASPAEIAPTRARLQYRLPNSPTEQQSAIWPAIFNKKRLHITRFR